MDISRHREVVNPYEYTQPIHIIGCGATGSWVGLILAKMGFSNIVIYDFDMVEEHNIPNQNYTISDIGCTKISALHKSMKLNNPDIDVNMHESKVDSSYVFTGIVFCLVDSMESRKEIWHNCIKNKIKVDLFIETRMGAEQGMVYTINPKNYNEARLYEQTLLYTDDMAETSLCGTSISVLPTAMSVASQAVWQLISHLIGSEYDSEVMVNYMDNEIFAQKFQ